MGWRTVVVSKSAKLDYQLGSMVVRQIDTVRIHIDEIDMLIIESTAVSITAALMCELSKKKVKVIFCDEKHNPSAELISYYGSYDTSDKVRKQILWSSEAKENIWTAIIREKILKQSAVLELYNLDTHWMLRRYADEIEPGDTTNREGHAAKVYFNSLFGQDFSRGDECSINAALNYGYAIILAYFNREIVANGYITQLGIFHDNMFNYFNLGSDLIEPFRPLVDRKVLELAPEKFEIEEKRIILNILNDTVIIANRKETVANAMKIYTKSVFHALNDNDSSLIKFYNHGI